jgi:hypothetical protein
VELAVENRRDDGAGHDARRRDANDELGVVGACDLEGERARQLTEERPFHVEHALAGVDGVATRH